MLRIAPRRQCHCGFAGATVRPTRDDRVATRAWCRLARSRRPCDSSLPCSYLVSRSHETVNHRRGALEHAVERETAAAEVTVRRGQLADRRPVVYIEHYCSDERDRVNSSIPTLGTVIAAPRS